jgi:outer membrane protein assembly factor BamB
MIRAAATVVDGQLYVGTEAGTMYGLDAATGQQLWQATLGNGIFTAAAVSDDTVYVNTFGDALYALDAVSGVQRWTVTPSKR